MVPPLRRCSAFGRVGTSCRATAVRTPDPLFDALATGCLYRRSPAASGHARILSGGRRYAFATSCRTRGARVGRSGAAATADRARSVAPVRRGRSPALGHAPTARAYDPLLRRPAWLPYASSHYVRSTGERASSTSRCRSSKGAAIPEGAEDGTTRGRQRSDASSVFESWRARDRSQLRVGARAAADGQRRLERRHEQRRPPRARRIGVARVVLVRSGRSLCADRAQRASTSARPVGTTPRAAGAMRAVGRLGRRVVPARFSTTARRSART